MSKRDFVRGMEHFAVDTWGLEAFFPEVEEAKIIPEARAPGDSLDLASVDEVFPDTPEARIIPDGSTDYGPCIRKEAAARRAKRLRRGGRRG